MEPRSIRFRHLAIHHLPIRDRFQKGLEVLASALGLFGAQVEDLIGRVDGREAQGLA